MAKLKRSKVNKHMLSEVIEEFISDKKSQKLSHETIKSYSEQLSIFMKGVGDIPIETFNEQVISKFNIWVEENLNYNDVSTNTIRRTCNVFLKYVSETYPVQPIKFQYVKVRPTIKKIFNDAELKRLTTKPDLNSVSYSHYRNYIITLIILKTGVRASSIVNLKVSDIDFKDKTITFTYTKNRQPVVFPIDQKLIKELKEYLAITERHTEYIFENSQDEQLTAKQLSVSYRRYCQANYCECTSIHQLRAVFGKKLLQETGNVFLVQRSLQHSSPSTTMRYLSSLGVSDFASDLEAFDIVKNLK